MSTKVTYPVVKEIFALFNRCKSIELVNESGFSYI